MLDANMCPSENLLARRVAKLDKCASVDAYGVESYVDRVALPHFISVIRRATAPFMKIEAGRAAAISPTVADCMVKASRLLQCITSVAPSLTVGPLRRNCQRWTVCGPAQCREPSAGRYIPPSATQKVAIKPRGVGLYTSSASVGGVAMWRRYLEGQQDAGLFPLPWQTWELRPEGDLKVLEVTNASAWVSFVNEHCLLCDGFAYPDWAAAAQKFDAIHITLPAIVALQGFCLPAMQGVIPPAFWDVETTFWLRWCFTSTHLMENVDASRPQLSRRQQDSIAQQP